jgi:L-malate glycosyltransferase
MKNILILTSVYPAEDYSKDATQVVHYFAKEWIQAGYNVKVIHNLKYYPQIFYFFINLFKEKISKFYKFVFPTRRYSNEKSYTLDGVEVYRLPIFKISPLALFTLKKQNLQLKKIINHTKLTGFIPDVIIGHWTNPQLFLVSELGKYFMVPTCMVMHSDVESIKRIFGKKAVEIVKKIDIWGFRSTGIKNRFEKYYGKTGKSFLCYSGIPANSIKPAQRTFGGGIKKFLFTGVLIPRKNPVILLKAIHKAFRGEDFHITFIGEGREKRNIEKLAKKINIKEKVSLPGRLPREKVFEMMRASDCFIMVSKPETFGLVYLEAMSLGCITIGSKGEGIDGIIRHGENGFLSEPGNPDELAELLKKISLLPEKELIRISSNAIFTASELTDAKVALHYIEAVKDVKTIQKNEAPIIV